MFVQCSVHLAGSLTSGRGAAVAQVGISTNGILLTPELPGGGGFACALLGFPMPPCGSRTGRGSGDALCGVSTWLRLHSPPLPSPVDWLTY